MSSFRFHGSVIHPVKTTIRFLQASGSLLGFTLFAAVLPASAQTVNLFPADAQVQWTRVAIPPTNPVSQVAQWHIDAAKRQILCDGNGGHDWLRFNKELGHFTFYPGARSTQIQQRRLLPE